MADNYTIDIIYCKYCYAQNNDHQQGPLPSSNHFTFPPCSGQGAEDFLALWPLFLLFCLCIKLLDALPYGGVYNTRKTTIDVE